MVMIRVCFQMADGQSVEAQAAAGDSLLTVGQAAGLSLEGTCEGQMACSTCHVIVDSDWFTKLTRASEDEEDMIDVEDAPLIENDFEEEVDLPEFIFLNPQWLLGCLKCVLDHNLKDRVDDPIM